MKTHAPQNSIPQAYFRIKELASRYGVSNETIERRIRDGSLKTIKIGPRIVAITAESVAIFEKEGQ